MSDEIFLSKKTPKNNTIVIGLTGQSGAGKTTVCEVFRQNGYAIINADIIAREVMADGKDCLQEVKDCFGKDILNENGSLNRQKLADIVFNDDEKLKNLNAICYPYITFEILRKINLLSEQNEKYIILDAPTLFESRTDDFCDLIISVLASEKNRLARILDRDNITSEQIIDRFSSQHSERYFINHSDYIIKNNKSTEQLTEKILDISEKIKEYYKLEKK